MSGGMQNRLHTQYMTRTHSTTRDTRAGEQQQNDAAHRSSMTQHTAAHEYTRFPLFRAAGIARPKTYSDEGRRTET